MKFLKKLAEIIELCTIKLPIWGRVFLALGLISIIGIPILISTINNTNNTPTERYENKENVYLYEEVEFADEIYIKVIGINVMELENTYTLNLKVNIEQWHTDLNVNQQEIRPDMFELRLVDKYAPSPMSVFVQSLANATISSMLSGAVGGEINVLEETLGFAEDYITGLIENSTSEEVRTINSNEDAFDPYYPYLENGVSNTVNLSFILNEEFLNSNQTMVLSIDDGLKRVQKNIFLVLRSNTLPYTIQFDLNDGLSNSLNNPIAVNPGQIINMPEEEPIKNGYKFLYWTTEKDKASKKIRDLYFYKYNENEIVTVYAYYQPTISLDEYANIGDDIYFKDGTYLIKITSLSFASNMTIKNSNQEDLIIFSSVGKKYLILNLLVEKTSIGNNHTLDNNDDFYLENDHSKQDVSGYYGYINFDSIKPMDDYSWIDLELSEIGTYQFTLAFEISESFDNLENLYFLEVDFFWGINSDSILIR